MATQSPPTNNVNSCIRNGLRYNSGLNHRKSDSDRWRNLDHDDNEFRALNESGIGGTECAERYSMAYHKVNATARPADKRHIYQQFETSLVDNNNKCLCKYDDEHFDRL